MTKYYQYQKEELIEQSKVKLNIYDSNEEIFKAIAEEMFAIIQENNQKEEPTVMICPVGPVGHYPYFVELVNEQNLNLKNTWFINMDEYLDDNGEWIDRQNRLSFRGFMEREVYGRIKPDLVMPEAQRIFPDPHHLDYIQSVIDRIGKVDACFGGIGINGHVAFNEPEPQLSNEEFCQLETRILTIDPMTRAVNAVGDLHGAIELMPQKCITIGMKQIIATKKIRLGVFRDWHQAVIRRAVCGAMTSEFPVTLLQKHPDYQVYAGSAVLEIGEK